MLAPSAAPQIGDCLLAFPFYITEYFFTKKKKEEENGVLICYNLICLFTNPYLIPGTLK